MSVTEQMIDAVLARKQTIDIGGFLYGNRHVIRDHEEERKRHDTVILWELVTDDYEAGHAAATAQFERIYTLRLLEAALSISYVHGAPNPMQSTICAACGLLKNTPLFRGEMGGYVCLTCADNRLDHAVKFDAAIGKINDIRNSIIGLQTMNWSEHIYPLVAALEEAGINGQGYPEARENFGTMLERTVSAEKRADAAEERAKQLEIALHNLLSSLYGEVMEVFEGELSGVVTEAEYALKKAPVAKGNLPLDQVSGIACFGVAYPIGAMVRKKSGSWWEGRVVGFYSTDQTLDGVCVQLDRPMGPVQIYPASALELVEG